MTGTILRYCAHRGCTVKVRAGRCQQHQLRHRRPSHTHVQASATVIAAAHVCARCGQGPRPGDPFERDHILSVTNGGTDHPANYQAAHRSCNRAAGAHITNGRRR